MADATFQAPDLSTFARLDALSLQAAGQFFLEPDPAVLLVTIRRHRCEAGGHVWRQDTRRAAAPRARLSCGGLRWALTALVCQHLTVEVNR